MLFCSYSKHEHPQEQNQSPPTRAHSQICRAPPLMVCHVFCNSTLLRWRQRELHVLISRGFKSTGAKAMLTVFEIFFGASCKLVTFIGPSIWAGREAESREMYLISVQELFFLLIVISSTSIAGKSKGLLLGVFLLEGRNLLSQSQSASIKPHSDHPFTSPTSCETLPSSNIRSFLSVELDSCFPNSAIRRSQTYGL